MHYFENNLQPHKTRRIATFIVMIILITAAISLVLTFSTNANAVNISNNTSSDTTSQSATNTNVTTQDISSNDTGAYCEISNAEPREDRFYYGKKRTTEGYTQYDVPANAKDYNELPWYDSSSSTSKVVVEESFKNFRPQSCSCWFLEFNGDYLPQGTTVSVTGVENIDTSECTNMYWMFGRCKALNIDTSKLNTSKVTNMSRMFAECSATSIDISQFDTSQVTNMSRIFENCTSNITGLSALKSDKLTDMHNMYMGVKADIIDVSGFKTDNVVTMASMFENAKGQIVGLEKFNTAKVTDMSHMFDNTNSPLNLSSFNTSIVENFDSMFAYYSGSEKLYDLNINFDISKTKSLNSMFANSKIVNLDLSSFETRGITNFVNMLSECEVTNLDIHNFDLSSAIYTTGMFAFNAEDVVWPTKVSSIKSECELPQLFNNCKCPQLNTRFINTSNITDMTCFFSNSAFNELDISSLDTSNVTNMNGMFEGCVAPKLDLRNFDFSNVTDMSAMFCAFGSDSTEILFPADFKTNNKCNMNSCFKQCKCKSVDLGSFNYKQFSDCRLMFADCPNLTSVLVPKGSDWSELAQLDDPVQQSNDEDQVNIFGGSVNLIGESGTKYDPEHIDFSYAHIDTPGNPGYFSESEKIIYPDPDTPQASNATNTSSTGDSLWFLYPLFELFVD